MLAFTYEHNEQEEMTKDVSGEKPGGWYSVFRCQSFSLPGTGRLKRGISVVNWTESVNLTAPTTPIWHP
jgi:hypothetical protein